MAAQVALMPGPYVQPRKAAQQEPVPLHARSELASCQTIRADSASHSNTGHSRMPRPSANRAGGARHWPEAQTHQHRALGPLDSYSSALIFLGARPPSIQLTQ